jgi:hypothetical protein
MWMSPCRLLLWEKTRGMTRVCGKNEEDARNDAPRHCRPNGRHFTGEHHLLPTLATTDMPHSMKQRVGSNPQHAAPASGATAPSVKGMLWPPIPRRVLPWIGRPPSHLFYPSTAQDREKRMKMGISVRFWPVPHFVRALAHPDPPVDATARIDVGMMTGLGGSLG